MKNIILLFLAMNVSVAFSQIQPVDIKPVSRDVIELPMANSGKAVIRLVFRNGSICDPAGKEGVTSLTSDMIIESGTKSMTSTDIRKMTYPWSARMSSFTDKEVSIFSFEVPTKYLDQFYTKVVRELFLNPSMEKNDFERLISNQKNGVEKVIRQSSDEEFGKKFLEYILFKNTPYAHLTDGTVASLSSITLDDVKNQYKKYYTRDNVTIGIGGDYPAAMVKTLRTDFDKLTEGYPEIPKLTMPPMPDGLNVNIISKPGALGSAISAGFPMNITRSNDEFAALMVANSWLGEHRKSYSRLYQKIREARSMNYGDYSYIEWYENGGSNMLPPPGTPRSMNYFSIWLRPVQTAKGLKAQYPELSSIYVGHAHFALRMAFKEMSEMLSKGMSKEDFESTRDFLKSYSKLYVETPSRKLGYLMDSRFYGRKDWISELDALLSKLTLDDVNNAMRKYWQTKNMEIVIVTDESEVAPLSENLRTEALSPMTYSNNLKATLPEDILSEDRTVAAFPMKIKNVQVFKSSEPFMK